MYIRIIENVSNNYHRTDIHVTISREGFMQMLEVDDFEYVDPVTRMAEIYLTSSVIRKPNCRKLDKRLAEVCSEEETIEMGNAEQLLHWSNCLDSI